MVTWGGGSLRTGANARVVRRAGDKFGMLSPLSHAGAALTVRLGGGSPAAGANARVRRMLTERGRVAFVFFSPRGAMICLINTTSNQ